MPICREVPSKAVQSVAVPNRVEQIRAEQSGEVLNRVEQSRVKQSRTEL